MPVAALGEDGHGSHANRPGPAATMQRGSRPGVKPAAPGSGTLAQCARRGAAGSVDNVTGAPGAGRLRVVIAEDSVLLLAGLTKLLESAGFEVAAAAGDASGLLAAVEKERPDLVIADVRMPPTHTDEGIRAALVIRAQWPAAIRSTR